MEEVEGLAPTRKRKFTKGESPHFYEIYKRFRVILLEQIVVLLFFIQSAVQLCFGPVSVPSPHHSGFRGPRSQFKGKTDHFGPLGVTKLDREWVKTHYISDAHQYTVLQSV